MKIVLRSSVAVLVLSVLTLLGVDRAHGETPAGGPTTVETAVIPVKGMACMACVGKTKQTLRAVSGVAEVEVKLSPGSATVKYDPAKVTPEKLVAVIKELGYEAELPAPKPAE